MFLQGSKGIKKEPVMIINTDIEHINFLCVRFLKEKKRKIESPCTIEYQSNEIHSGPFLRTPTMNRTQDLGTSVNR